MHTEQDDAFAPGKGRLQVFQTIYLYQMPELTGVTQPDTGHFYNTDTDGPKDFSGQSLSFLRGQFWKTEGQIHFGDVPSIMCQQIK